MDVKCPSGYLIGHDFACYPDCGPKCNTLWECSIYKKSCIGKADFGSETMANHEVQKRDGYSAYHCKYCNGWHIGRNWGLI